MVPASRATPASDCDGPSSSTKSPSARSFSASAPMSTVRLSIDTRPTIGNRAPRCQAAPPPPRQRGQRSEEHTSELQSLMRISYAVFCLKKKTINITLYTTYTSTYDDDILINMLNTY